MPVIFRFIFLMDLGMIWCETSFPSMDIVWPFTVNHFARLALMLMAALIVSEARELIAKLRRAKSIN